MTIAPGDPHWRPPANQRNGCLTALMVLGGIILLSPGLCAIAIIVDDPRGAFGSSSFVPLILMLSLGAGAALLWVAVGRARR
jgi:hypothetical protein